MDRRGSLAQAATPAQVALRAESIRIDAPSRIATPGPGTTPSRFVTAPLAPALAAVAIGILFDRWCLALETQTLCLIALAPGVIAVFANRHARLCNMALLAAFPFIGAGWHHYRWSDMDADDLARTVTETSRPAWVRGIVSEARGLRHQRPGFGFGGGDQEKVTTRFVLDITSISDGQTWRKASGRAIVVVTGDLSSIRAGQAVETAGQISTLGRTAQSR